MTDTPTPRLKFVTHARSLQELRDEFLSDINRRLESLDLRLKYTKQATEAAKLASRRLELEELFAFWQSVELRSERSRKANNSVGESQS